MIPTYSPTAKILANVQRYGRFYLASMLTGLLALLLLLSARLERGAASPEPDYAAQRPVRPAAGAAHQPWAPIGRR